MKDNRNENCPAPSSTGYGNCYCKKAKFEISNKNGKTRRHKGAQIIEEAGRFVYGEIQLKIVPDEDQLLELKQGCNRI